ncbi:ATP-binding protein [Calidithermus chliarophilus]|uniref:ATP-binding protein n=1 Tax=Calidithermus chliarophilus TaxID=52023 RepID=UPI0004101E4B|nr:ATP-binding protein [Calidithermus chliarophilus]
MWKPLPAQKLSSRFTPESRQKDRKLFEYTHLPIGRIHITQSRRGFPGEFIGEAQLLEWVVEGRPGTPNRIFLLCGEAGSGKSELCQWLEYTLPPTHPPVHLARSQGNLTSLYYRLLRFLPDPPQMGALDIPPDLLVQYLQTHLRLGLVREGEPHLQEYGQQVIELLPGLAEALRRPHDEQTLRSLLPPHAAADQIARRLVNASRQALGVQSLEPLLKQIVEYSAQQGRRPVLLLEDVTTLGFLREDLLDFLFDLSMPGLDAVIGVTTGFEAHHLSRPEDPGEMAYVRDRLEARLLLSDEAGGSYFLGSPGELVALARGYLRGLFPGRRSHVFAGVYPFTPAALEKIWANLVESGNPRQTPRALLDGVIRPVLADADPPFLSLTRNRTYLRPPSVTFRTGGLSEAEIGLLFWYGERSGERVAVAPEVLGEFGYAGPLEAEAYPYPPGQVLRVIQPSDRTPEWEEALRQLQMWLSGEVFPRRQALKRGISRFLEAHFTPRALLHPASACLSAAPLMYTRGGGEVPMLLEGSGDVPPPSGTPLLWLRRTSLPREQWEEFLNFAYSQFTALEAFADPAATYERAQSLALEFQEGLRAHLANLLGVPYEQAVLGMWSLALHLAHGWGEKELSEPRRLVDYTAPSHGPVWMAGAPQEKTQVLSRTNGEVLEQFAGYRALWMSVFHTRDNFVDSDLLRAHLAYAPLRDIWDRLSGIDLRTVSKSPYRQQHTGLSLHELLRPVVEHLRALKAYDPQPDVQLLRYRTRLVETFQAEHSGLRELWQALARAAAQANLVLEHLPFPSPEAVTFVPLERCQENGFLMPGLVRHALRKLEDHPVVQWERAARTITRDLRYHLQSRWEVDIWSDLQRRFRRLKEVWGAA